MSNIIDLEKIKKEREFERSKKIFEYLIKNAKDPEEIKKFLPGLTYYHKYLINIHFDIINNNIRQAEENLRELEKEASLDDVLLLKLKFVKKIVEELPFLYEERKEEINKECENIYVKSNNPILTRELASIYLELNQEEKALKYAKKARELALKEGIEDIVDEMNCIIKICEKEKEDRNIYIKHNFKVIDGGKSRKL